LYLLHLTPDPLTRYRRPDAQPCRFRRRRRLALDTVCDLIDSSPIRVGSADAFYLFGGPFLQQVPSDSGNSGLGVLQSRCIASLNGVVGTSTTHLVLAIDHLSTTFAGHTLSNVTGVATVASVVEFRTDSRPQARSGAVSPVLALDTAIASFVPDKASESAMLAALGGNQQLYKPIFLRDRLSPGKGETNNIG
jgi:hypothetical protein